MVNSDTGAMYRETVSWPNYKRPTCRMLTKEGRPSDRPCLDSRGQVRISRVRVFRVMVFIANSVSGVRHRRRQPSWLTWP